MGLAKIVMMIAGALAGGWMLFDGVHVLVRGKYFGPDKPGPWSALVARVGVDPFKLGPLFIALGALWLICLIAALLGKTWGWSGAAAAAVASLWYFPLGTFLALVYLLLFFLSA
jgi:hypothetical protein